MLLYIVLFLQEVNCINVNEIIWYVVVCFEKKLFDLFIERLWKKNCF